MITDCRKWADLPDGGESQRGRVLVDGKKIDFAWYVDTDAGIVKTYDMGDGKGPKHTKGFNGLRYPSDWEVELDGEVVSRVIRGKVELKPL